VLVFIVKLSKRPQGKMMAQIEKRSMNNRTDEKHLKDMTEDFIGVVKLAFYCYKTRFLLSIMCHLPMITLTA
jgi:hypothetical protein